MVNLWPPPLMWKAQTNVQEPLTLAKLPIAAAKANTAKQGIEAKGM
jgi:hypothetical protein